MSSLHEGDTRRKDIVVGFNANYKNIPATTHFRVCRYTCHARYCTYGKNNDEGNAGFAHLVLQALNPRVSVLRDSQRGLTWCPTHTCCDEVPPTHVVNLIVALFMSDVAAYACVSVEGPS